MRSPNAGLLLPRPMGMETRTLLKRLWALGHVLHRGTGPSRPPRARHWDGPIVSPSCLQGPSAPAAHLAGPLQNLFLQHNPTQVGSDLLLSPPNKQHIPDEVWLPPLHSYSFRPTHLIYHLSPCWGIYLPRACLCHPKAHHRPHRVIDQWLLSECERN